MSSINDLFDEEQKTRVVAAIERAEAGTSAEIRVHIDSTCSGDPVKQAVRVFNRLDMYKTRERNGVLIYVATDSRKCAIVGDVGIDKCVDKSFWDDCCRRMVDLFRRGEFCEGVIYAVEQSGAELKRHFVHRADDKNELPNEISIGEE